MSPEIIPLYFAQYNLQQVNQLDAAFDQFLDDLEAGLFSMPSTINTPWYELAEILLQHSLSEPFDTRLGSKEAFYYGWPTLLDALDVFADNLPMPKGCDDIQDVFKPDLQHRLYLQICFDWLSGVGGEDEISLKDDDQQGRVDAFIEELSDHHASVAFLQLNTETVLQRLAMPPEECILLRTMLMAELGLDSAETPLIDVLNFDEN